MKQNHTLLLYFREEELKRVLQGDFIPALCTLSLLARLCLNRLEGRDWNAPDWVIAIKL